VAGVRQVHAAKTEMLINKLQLAKAAQRTGAFCGTRTGRRQESSTLSALRPKSIMTEIQQWPFIFRGMHG
jgi:hypothetical protein